MDGDYDSYSSEDDTFKKKKPAKVTSSMIIQKVNPGVNKIRSSAPLLTDINNDSNHQRNSKSYQIAFQFLS